MALKKRVRIIKKIRPKAGEWKFISMRKIGNRYVWDKRPGYFFVEWWDRPEALPGDCRYYAKRGDSEAQRRKQNELVGELLGNGKELPTARRGHRNVTSRMQSPSSPTTSAPTRPTSRKPSSVTERCWNTSSGTLGNANSSKRAPAPTLTTTRPNGRARRANSTTARSPRVRSTSK